MKVTKIWVVTIVMVIGGLLAGCGGDATPEPVTFDIEMSEFAYTPNTIEVKVGQEVTINLTNNGMLDHEFMAGQNVMMTDSRPSGYEHDLFAEAGVEPMVMGGMVMDGMDMGGDGEMDMEGEDDHADDGEMDMAEGDDHGHAGFMVTVPMSGETASITFTVTEDMVGEWEFGCFLQEGTHYSAGMTGTLIVTP